MTMHEVGIALALVSSLAAGASAQGQGESIVKLPGDIVFKAPARPGPESAVLYGDPSKAGAYVTRVRLPAGLKLMPNWRAEPWRTAVVLSGTLYFGIGEQWEDSKLVAYPPGTFFSHPYKTPHFAWAKDGDVILQFTGMGPAGATQIPQK